MNSRRFTFAVGDIHGCLEQLEALLASIESVVAGGRVVFLGDLVDRGPDSRGVVERIMGGPRRAGWEWITLKGNHEAMLLAARKGQAEMSLWLTNGGEETMASYCGAIPLSHLVWMAELPSLVIDRHRIFVHAGVDETIPLEEQGDDILLWIRTVRTTPVPIGASMLPRTYAEPKQSPHRRQQDQCRFRRRLRRHALLRRLR